MKKRFLIIALLSVMFSVNAQDGKAILPFVDGKTLSSDDIGFLDVISNKTEENARGAVSEVTIDGSSLEAGQVLTKEVARKINVLISSYLDSGSNDVTDESKSEVAEGKARGCGYYCYYYYWDSYCYCYRYVWYYCCI